MSQLQDRILPTFTGQSFVAISQTVVAISQTVVAISQTVVEISQTLVKISQTLVKISQTFVKNSQTFVKISQTAYRLGISYRSIKIRRVNFSTFSRYQITRCYSKLSRLKTKYFDKNFENFTKLFQIVVWGFCDFETRNNFEINSNLITHFQANVNV